jgi:hypothetical protein
MTRRLFIQDMALGGMALDAAAADALSRPPRLAAFVNAGMPASITLPAGAPRAPLYELRAYARPVRIQETLRAAGAAFLVLDQSAVLLPLAGLRQRAEIWDRVSSSLTEPSPAYRFALYHAS